MEALLILPVALVLDLALGEPPSVIHPVVWIGKVISFLIKGGRRCSPTVQFFYGLGVVLVTLGIFVPPVYFLLSYLKDLNSVAYVVVAAVIFKTCFSLKELWRAALTVRNLLAEDKLAEARFELRALVGRDTSKLDKSLMVSATVESVAESSCDSFFAPLFYFLLFGLAGAVSYLGVVAAVAYRVINTHDSMIGHHGEFEYLGKFAARLDSAVNFIPARIAALTIVLSSWVCRAKASGAWRIMLRDRRKTKSPNKGWTMSAMAGALGVQLEKVGYYKLGDNSNSLLIGSIDASLKIVMTAAFIWSLAIVLAEVVYHVAA
jgi:adenosylcobinamide-phosphate synthase